MRPSIRRSNLVANNVEKYCSTIRQIASSVKELGMMVPPDDGQSCKDFKRKQIYHLLNGDLLATNMQKTSAVAKELLQQSNSVESHLAVLNLRVIRCNHPEMTEKNQTSVLDIHNSRSADWCNNCINITSAHTPNFTSGTVNPFVCWRRGQRSGKLGFLHHAHLKLKGGKVILGTDKIYTKSLLQGMIFNSYPNLNVEISDRIPNLGTSMVSVIIMHSDTESIVDRKEEIKSLLPPQMLVSRHIDQSKFSTIKSTDTLTKVTMVEELQKLLTNLHATWLNSISNQSRGIIGIGLINNGSKYVEENLLQNMLTTFSDRNDLWYGKYDLDKLPSTLLEELGLSSNPVPDGCSALCLILDTIVDLGGI